MPTDTCTTIPLSWNQLIVEPLNKFFTELAWFIPDLLTALCIIVTGWVAGRILQLISAYFLKSVGFDGFAKKIGIVGLLEEGEVKQPASEWSGKLVFWLVMLFALARALEKVTLNMVSGQLAGLLHFVGQIFTMVVIFIAGMFLSFITARIVSSAAAGAKMNNPQLCGKVAKYLVLLFTILACLMQLEITARVIMVAITGIFAAVCVAAAIAFGMGGIGWAGKVLERIGKK